VKSVAWDSTGTLLATCSRDKSVWIWEMEEADHDFECVAVLNGHSQDVKQVQFHPKKELLASASYDDTVKFWVDEEDDWNCVDTLQGHSSTVWSIAFSNDGNRLISASADLSLIVWQYDEKTSRYHQGCVLTGYHTRPVYSVDISGNGLIVTGCGDDAIRVFEEDQDNMDESHPSYNLIGTFEKAHSSDVNCVAWHPKYPGCLASCGDDNLVKLWHFAPPKNNP